MTYPWAKRLLTLIVGALFLFTAKAVDAQEAYQGLKPTDNVFVYDYADLISQQQEQLINQELVAFKDTTSNVIIIVTHPDLFGEEAWRFATDLGHAWGVGTGENDNGLVMVVKPKTRASRGQAFIATGYGLEGAIPDAVASRIVDGEMIPRFKQDDYVGGIYAGVQVLKGLAAGEIKEYAGPKNSKKVPWGFLLLILFGIGGAIASMFWRVRRYAHMNDMGFWAAWAMLSATSRSHGGHWNSFSGGSGGFGGGGGFGGFGGGGFGGGGAGGSW